MPLAINGNAVTVLLVNEALFNAPASVSNYFAQRLELDMGNISTAAYANQMTDANLSALSDAELATRVLNNVLGQDGNNNPVLNAALTYLFDTYHADRGVVIYQAVLGLCGLEGDPAYGAAAQAWVARINDDYAHTAPPMVDQQPQADAIAQAHQLAQVRLVGHAQADGDLALQLG